MIFHENRLLADDSRVISYRIFFCRKLGKMSQIFSSAAVVIDTVISRLSSNTFKAAYSVTMNIFRKILFSF